MTLVVVKRKRSDSQSNRNVKPKLATKGAKITMSMIRKAALSGMETKRYAINLGSNIVAAAALTDGVPICSNLLYWQALGNNDSTRVGDEITITGISVRGTVGLNGSVGGALPSLQAHGILMLVKDTAQVQTGTVAPNTLNYPTDYRVAFLGDSAHPIIDTNKVTVVHKQPFTLGRGTTTSATQACAEQTIGFDKKFTDKFKFTSSTSGYGKFHNYYVVLCVNSNNGLLAGTGQNYTYRLNATVFYKDS